MRFQFKQRWEKFAACFLRMVGAVVLREDFSSLAPVIVLSATLVYTLV